MADDRLAELEADVQALSAATHAHTARLAVLEALARRAEDDADRLLAVELGLARLATGQRVAVAVLVFAIPLLVRLLGGL